MSKKSRNQQLHGNEPLDIDIDHSDPLINLQIEDFAQQHHACIVDKHVNFAKLLDGCRNNALPVTGNGHVELAEGNFSGQVFFLPRSSLVRVQAEHRNGQNECREQ